MERTGAGAVLEIEAGECAVKDDFCDRYEGGESEAGSIGDVGIST